MNIKVGMIFYFLTIFLAFFSRRIFLDCLGAEFIGLTGMLMNIMSYLSVAELGIGTSIVYFLYKPLQENNHDRICEITSILAYLYRCIGFTIGAGGIIVSFFFPWWFGELNTGLFIVYFAFYSFLGSSVAGYIFNYKQLLVGANQKQYVVNGYFQTIGIIQSISQILIAYFYPNLYLWIIIGFFFTIVGCVFFNYRIRQEYPWLIIDLNQGKKNLKRYPEVLKKTRQIFAQKIKDLILYRSDELLVGIFVSVTQVAYFGNYMIIINKLNFLTNILSDGMNAGIGNLIAEGNINNTMKVFWELTAIRFFITGFIVFGLLMYIQPFIACWLGSQYVLDDIIVYLLVLNIFVFLSRGVVEMYKGACGLFSDVWTAWVELIINIGVTLCTAPYWGIVGILIGKITSVFFIAFFWKPYFLFTKGLHQPVNTYWKGMSSYYIIIIIFCVISIIIRNEFFDHHTITFYELVIYGVISFIPIVICYFYTLFFATKGMKFFVARKPRLYNILTLRTLKNA